MWVVIHYSLVLRKKETAWVRSALLLQRVLAGLEQPLRPRLGPLDQVDGHEDRDQHAAGEEVAHLLRRGARRLLDELDDVAPRGAHGAADVRVVARRPALEHEHEAV